MDDSIDLGELLRAQGHRLTNPRRHVWEALASAGHLTADQVADRVRTADEGINLASIYRSLALFAELGLARESKIGSDGAARWEVAHPDDEFHLICSSCGKVQHHGGDLVEQVRRHLGAEHGFQAATVELAVNGRCADCP
jgi:Fe2+ or Zn2+ uptake regulation protein